MPADALASAPISDFMTPRKCMYMFMYDHRHCYESPSATVALISTEIMGKVTFIIVVIANAVLAFSSL
eukprot:5004547-Pyramimonas_sp.AAC.1